MPRAALALLALALVVAAVPAGAHGPPKVREQDFRLLADHNDDCGGDDAGPLSRCRSTHDLIGLDVTERHDPARGDVVVFRLLLNGGSGTVTDTVRVKVDGTERTFAFTTSDNKAFTGTGFDAVSGAVSANDGSRFWVEGTVRLEALGGAGRKLTDYTVESARGTTKGDVMPGCYHDPVTNAKVADGQCNAANAEAPGTGFSRTTGYTLQGPTYYASVDMPDDATVPANGETTLELRVENAFRETSQVATLAITGADGASATWSGGGSETTLDLLKAGSGTATLRLRGDGQAAIGELTLTLTTSLGGRSVHKVPYEVTAAGSTSDPDDGPSSADKDAPAPAGLLAGALLLALAAARRRA